MKIETVTLVTSSQVERGDEGIQEIRHEDSNSITTGPSYEQVIEDGTSP